MVITDYQLKDLDRVADQILKQVTHQKIIFKGDLGAGKTTLIKALVQKLGSDDLVSSPTFSIVNEYKLKASKIYHFDFYRIENEEEAYDIGFEDYIDADAWVFIEWPEKIPHLLDFDHHCIYIGFNAQLQRVLELK
ncbi:MAG: tRNA (adenosine(37)-N6)-threonylcarbamoyltransferase complex ATPase subunit type 1 TsaE [Flavobacteriaceae bacterium]|nr:tRNA (adenosine(37)-N6)-threonylcarbamoyltransferase complex ATPase subunit type 1 TsaE [Psychroflexus sp.]